MSRASCMRAGARKARTSPTIRTPTPRYRSGPVWGGLILSFASSERRNASACARAKTSGVAKTTAPPHPGTQSGIQ